MSDFAYPLHEECGVFGIYDRAGTEDVPSIVGMAAALDEACEHRAEHTARLIPLRDKLIAGLAAIPHAALNGDAEKLRYLSKHENIRYRLRTFPF